MEYRIIGCKNKRMLPFDCAILDHNDNLKLLIEYQGIQHGKIVERFGGIKGLEERTKNDGIKKKY
ncbi:hypothetical protein KPL47_22635 [Clostridium estertheticum]|uniref:hypothetical protein n=1 Tax=Clostridium estertheticum TaxID=238834 RepID=UPI001C0B1A8B|nr:hypothetical protein [Clostridium estertheticum]MBU3179094.1 hypothetical protein [Clostridium estertheticum]